MTDVPSQGLLHLDAEPKQSKIKAFVQALNEYKELIAILASVIGGAIWIVGYFVTKSQFAELKCYAKHSIIANRESLRLRDADAAIVEKSHRFEELQEREKVAPLTDRERMERKRLDLELEKVKEAQKSARERLSKAQAKLEDNDCMSGEEK